MNDGSGDYEYRGRRTVVWVKRDQHWQCVTIHTSAFGKQ
jgi:hypothetical protein